MSFLKIFARNLAQGPSTDPFPFGETFTPAALRGRVQFDVKDCTGCRACEQVCAGIAIRLDKVPEGLRFLMFHNTCTFCGLCEFYCPTKAIRLSNDWNMAHHASEGFSQFIREVIPAINCSQCNKPALATYPLIPGVNPPLNPEEVEIARGMCPGCRRKFVTARGQKA
jgi:formate hydrogenlyase subunit 6/NADH:ubiquinone oxidoreductase subunit I